MVLPSVAEKKFTEGHKKMKICVTGAGGFIASHLSKRLKEEGHFIRVHVCRNRARRGLGASVARAAAWPRLAGARGLALREASGEPACWPRSEPALFPVTGAVDWKENEHSRVMESATTASSVPQPPRTAWAALCARGEHPSRPGAAVVLPPACAHDAHSAAVHTQVHADRLLLRRVRQPGPALAGELQEGRRGLRLVLQPRGAPTTLPAASHPPTPPAPLQPLWRTPLEPPRDTFGAPSRTPSAARVRLYHSPSCIAPSPPCAATTVTATLPAATVTATLAATLAAAAVTAATRTASTLTAAPVAPARTSTAEGRYHRHLASRAAPAPLDEDTKHRARSPRPLTLTLTLTPTLTLTLTLTLTRRTWAAWASSSPTTRASSSTRP